MGYIYEELIRRFSELSNETAGEHFTPREVIRLMVNLLFIEDDDAAHQARRRPHALRPRLRHRRHAVRRRGPPARAEPDGADLEVYGQELNAETYAICRSDMMHQGPGRLANIVLGNTLHRGRPRRARRFDYLLANPPFGVEWKKVEKAVQRRARARWASTAASAPACRASTTARLLFLQHMISQDEAGRARAARRVAIVFNGSPLFTGGAGSGESEIRRWIIENDWLEAIVALPDQLFYNTGISTYVWIVTNRKRPERAGKVQLIDARELWHEDAQEPRREAQASSAPTQIAEITRLYGDASTEGDAGQDPRRTRPSASSASPSSARCGCAGRSPTTRSQRSRAAKPAGQARRRRRRRRSSTRSASLGRR